ncbi:hypothetical protein P8452_57945 [Trifolium repens]|nr:hypothetical protein P8452_57945 [Trifolium repens]
MKFFGIVVVVSKRRNQCNVTESELSLLLLFGLRCVPLHKETNVAIARCRALLIHRAYNKLQHARKQKNVDWLFLTL